MALKYLKSALNGDGIVQEIVYKIIKDNNIETVVETGTHTGLSTAFFGNHTKNVITTEISPDWLAQAKNSLKDYDNIQFFQGDSATVLKNELPKLANQKVLFFLDAHFNNDLALDRELEAIAESEVVPYVIIHDFQVPSRGDLGYDGWDGKVYNLENLKHLVGKVYPEGYSFYYNEKSDQGQRGCIFIEPVKKECKKVIYTAMFGGLDEANDPIVDLPGWDMLFFTDAKLKSNKWDIINVPQKEEFDSVQMSRQYKMFPHKHLQDYDLSLWVDASILIRQPIDEFVDLITDDVKMGIYQHTSSWETELSCMHRWTDDMELLEKMKSDYQDDGYDTESKIMSGNVILREHDNVKLIETMELWWEKFNQYYIKRDQVGLAYSVWKNKLKVNFFPGLHPRGDRNPYFKNLDHKRTHRIK